MFRHLDDGTAVWLRRIRPRDKDLLVSGLRQLSPDTVQKRFLGPKSRLSGSELRYLTEIDGADHAAFIAVLAEDTNRLAGVARYVRLPDEPWSAEAAILVGDCHQRQGLGTILGLALADHARENGIARFVATILGDNVAAHRLMEKLSTRLTSEAYEGGVHEVHMDLAA